MNEVRSIFQFQSEQQQIRYILYAVQISTHHEAVYICGIGTRVPKVVDNVSAPSLKFFAFLVLASSYNLLP